MRGHRAGAAQPGRCRERRSELPEGASRIHAEEAIPIDASATPRVTFTDPQVAAAGMTAEQARRSGVEPKVTSMSVANLPRAVVSHRGAGLIRRVADAQSDRLLGAHMMAPHAGDIIGEATLAIRMGLGVQELVSTLHPYLTWGEGIRLAGQTFTKDVAKLSCCALGDGARAYAP